MVFTYATRVYSVLPPASAAALPSRAMMLVTYAGPGGRMRYFTTPAFILVLFRDKFSRLFGVGVAKIIDAISYQLIFGQYRIGK